MNEKITTISFTEKELNYIGMALLNDIRHMELDRLSNAGNMPHLRRFQKALANRIMKERGGKPHRWQQLIKQWRAS
jgi:hypothetical protein